jgi:hypothetical protein
MRRVIAMLMAAAPGRPAGPIGMCHFYCRLAVHQLLQVGGGPVTGRLRARCSLLRDVISTTDTAALRGRDGHLPLPLGLFNTKHTPLTGREV